jgi:OmpA-OmpF porin, OOP family
MRARYGLAGLVLTALLVARPAASDPTGSYGYIVPFAGYTIFDGDLRFPNSHLTDEFNLGGRLGWQLRPWVALEAAGGFTATNEDTLNGADVDFFHYSGNLVFTPFSGVYGGPFISAGFGNATLKPSGGGDEMKMGNLEIAAGLNLWFTDFLGARLEARDLMWLNKEEPTDIEAHNWIVGAGLTVALGAKARDTDGDGVSDRKDQCPDTPKGATVDATGCPTDSDGDAVFDGLDKCPNTPKGATVDATGCPADSDADGVPEGLDKCPSTPRGATVDATGCPTDTDGDGVFDGIDKCADTPKGAVIDSSGCPVDSDGDGVPNGLDDCPDTERNLKVDAKGCPVEVIEIETEMLDTGMIREEQIYFETGKADLKSESFPALDLIGTVLMRWPQLKIEIGGHTDSRGSVGLNQRLSEARAKSVATYLADRFPGLPREQYSTKGYGESKPVVKETDDTTRSRNRRVEFVILNKEELKKEIERRRLLQKSEPIPAAPDTTRR